MSDAKKPPAERVEQIVTIDLGEQEGEPVVGSAIALRNAGDGLSDAMAVDPVILRRKETGYAVIAWEVDHIEFPPAKKGQGVLRKHVLRATHSAIVTEEFAAQAIAASKKELIRKREEALGIQHLDLPGDGESPDEADVAAVGNDSTDEDA